MIQIYTNKKIIPHGIFLTKKYLKQNLTIFNKNNSGGCNRKLLGTSQSEVFYI